ncbi:protoporphyrinogen oxidase [Paenibacillus thailandensis]|uniref:Coproporphyrinogen III oxidase n=1 Tax=Paenibacillus thailandensis TaxID=393250 RepID=A0ABW5QUN7_9BACL
MKTIVIVGGGVTGLSTAYYLNRHIKHNKLDAKIVLIEAEDRLGGKIRTVHTGEYTMETGADSIVTRKSNVAPLLEELGLSDDVVYNATGKSFIYIDGELKPIPEDTVFGIPLSLESLAKSTLISAEGKVEALKDFYTENKTFTKDDSIGEFLESFLGEELVRRQISPVLSGVYSGKLHELTIASTMPYLLEYKNKYGSIMKGLAENKQQFKGSGNKKFLSFGGGVSVLIDRLEALSGAEIRTGVRAESIAKREEGGYRIRLQGSEELNADCVVLATLSTAAAQLLKDESLNEHFSRFKHSSLISVYLGFRIPDSALPEDGTGFIAAEDSGLTCDACTWTSRKWEHTSREKHLLVRMFYKSSNPAYERLKNQTDEQLLQTALADIKRAMGIVSDPVAVNVTKWHDTMPNYHLRHRQLVESLEQKMAADYPDVWLAGCSYYGVGIPDCIANGESTARRIAERLSAGQ